MRQEDWDQSARCVQACSLHARQLVTGFGRLDSGREGRFTGTIRQRRPEGLFSLVAMYTYRFRYCEFAEWNRIGGARKKWGSQRPRATLRREVHAAEEVLEARGGALRVEMVVRFERYSLVNTDC